MNRLRAGAFLGVLLVLSAPAWPAGGAATPPVLAVTLAPGAPPAVVGAEVELQVPAAQALGPNLIANPGFDLAGLDPWRSSVGTLGTAGSITVKSGTVALEALKAARTDSLWLSQRVPLDATHTYALRFRATDLGANASQLTVSLREQGPGGSEFNTTFDLRPPPFTQEYAFAWQPHSAASSNVTLGFAVRAGAGQSIALRLDNAVLQAIAAVAWNLGDGTLLAADGPTARVRFPTAGPHPVSASGSDQGTPVWTANGTIAVAALAGVATIQLPAAALSINVPFTFDASTSVNPALGFGLADPVFARIGTTWAARPDAPPLDVTVRALADDRGAAEVRAKGAASSTPVFLAQTVLVKNPGPATLAVRVLDSGNLVRYEFLIRESDGAGTSRDTTYRFPAVGATETVLSMNWTSTVAKSRQVTVFLRYIAPAGQESFARFIQPRLLDGLKFDWLLDGKVVQTGRAPSFTVVPRAAGSHNLTVRVVDAQGTALRATTRLTYQDGGYTWDDPVSKVVPIYPDTPLRLETIRRAEGRDDQLKNGDFAHGTDPWTTDSGKTVVATLQVRQEGATSYARLQGKATQAGTAWITQPADDFCKQVPCTLTFEYRSTDPVTATLHADASPTDKKVKADDTQAKGGAVDRWTLMRTNWSPDPAAGDLLVRIAVTVPAGQTARLDVRGIRLEPRLDFTVQVDGKATVAQSLGGLSVGGHRLRVAVNNTFGQGDVFDRKVNVIPVTAFETQDGQFGLQLAPGKGSVRIERDGKGWAYDLEHLDVQGPFDSFTAGGSLFLRLPLDGGAGITFVAGGNSTKYEVADLASSLPVAQNPVTEALLTHSGWQRKAKVAITLAAPDPSLVSGYVLFLEHGRVVANQTLRQDGDRWMADAPAPFDLAAHNYTLGFHLTDGWGHQTTLANQPIVLERNGYILAAILLAGAVVLILGAGEGYRRVRAARRRL